MSLSSFRKKFDEKVWGDDPSEEKPSRLKPKRLMRLIVAVARDTEEGDLNLRATSLVYTTLLSFAPLLAICFSVLKAFGVQNQIEPFLRDFLSPLGDRSGAVTENIIGFVSNIQVGVLGTVGFLFLVYGVISLLQQIEEAFNDIWRLSSARSFTMRMRDYTTVLFIGPLFLFLSTAMSAALHNAVFMQRWLGINILGGALEYVFSILPYVLFMLAFSALYMFMPNTRVKAGPALISGLVTGIIWKLLGFLFVIFVAGSGSYAAIYSVFAALVLFIIWIYAGWMVVLIGASLCYYLQNPSNQPMSRRFRRLSARLREKLALQICAEVGAAFYKHDAGVDVAYLSSKLLLPAVVIESVTDDLISAGILTQATSDGHFMPNVPFEATTAEEALIALRTTDETDILNVSRLKAAKTVDDILKRSEAAAHQALGEITLKQLSLEETEA